ncbi:hypothetical protein GGI42DRAFT_135189 [Trichoderma sp. SZMC 28013]
MPNRLTDEVQLARLDATFLIFPALLPPLSFAFVAFISFLSFKTREEKKDVMCGQNGQYGFSSMFKGRSLEGKGENTKFWAFFSPSLFFSVSVSFFFFRSGQIILVRAPQLAKPCARVLCLGNRALS